MAFVHFVHLLIHVIAIIKSDILKFEKKHFSLNVEFKHTLLQSCHMNIIIIRHIIKIFFVYMIYYLQT